MMVTNDSIAFYVSELIFIVRMFLIAFLDGASKGLFASFFLMAVWFSFSFHRQFVLTEDSFFKHAIKCFHTTRDRFFISTNYDVWRPAFIYFLIDVINFIVGKLNGFTPTLLFVFPVLTVNINRCFAIFKLPDYSVDGFMPALKSFSDLTAFKAN